DNAVDVIKLTPAHLSLLAGMNLKNSRTHTLILGGEDLTTAVAQQAQRLFRSNIRIFNEYGPTEAVVGCMIHRYRPETDKGSSVPIGKPADGVNIYLLDAGGNPVPQGVTGEIWIGGRRLAAGYKNQPELTEQRFLPDPFLGSGRMYRTGDLARTSESNQLLFLGRKDTQLKIRGVRIETAEISNAVKSHPLVSDCHVMALQPLERVDHQPVHYCTTCGLASNYPGVSFNQNGKCNHCQDFDSYRDLAAGYFRSMPQLKKLLHNMSLSKRGNYDLLMLLSGGKDSTYALYQVCAMGLKVFAMTLDNGYISEGAKANIRRSVADLDIEHEFVTTDAMNAIFSDSLNRHSSVCYGCFKTIYTLAINHAHQRGIPVIVTGLSRGQMFETRLTKQVFEQSEFDPDLIDREVLETRKVYHRIPDKVTECVDMSLFDSDDIFNEIQFVDFYRYCDVSMEEMYAFLEQHAPWTRPADTGRSTNCLINDTGIYVHKNKLGYHNYALPYSWDVRLGHKQRDAALEELNDQIDAGRVHEILQEIDYRDTDLTEGADHKKLVAYYTGSELVGIEEMRSYLRARLPEAMIPSYYVHLGSIPLTANGKIDQDALPDPRNERPKLDQAVIPANTDTEKILAKIWREALRINQVGIYDNFFDLGGDSIIAIQIVVRASEEGISMTPNQLFLHQTIHELAAASVIQDSENKSQQTDDDEPFSLLNQDDDLIKNLSTLLDT
ncbi:MAG: AMP-binding protein, partial [Gammaproteobacteria bacterium]